MSEKSLQWHPLRRNSGCQQVIHGTFTVSIASQNGRTEIIDSHKRQAEKINVSSTLFSLFFSLILHLGPCLSANAGVAVHDAGSCYFVVTVFHADRIQSSVQFLLLLFFSPVFHFITFSPP